MKLYFSGVNDDKNRAMLQEAGVSHLLVDPVDMWRVMDWKGGLALDSGAYRCWKEKKHLELMTYAGDVIALYTTRQRQVDFFVAPDVFGDPDATFKNWQAFCPLVEPLVPVPVWNLKDTREHLYAYLDASPIVGIGALVPSMRAKSKVMLKTLHNLCEEFPYRFHLFGANWLKAIEEVQDLAYSVDTSKWLDGARYARVIFKHTRNGHLSQAPAKVIKEYAMLKRVERCVLNARNMEFFCHPKAKGEQPWLTQSTLPMN